MDGTLREPERRVTRKPVVPNGVLGIMIFMTSEVMFFAGMMSAFTIVRASSMPLMWPPMGQPTLPASATALNTVALILSGVALFFAHRAFQKNNKMGMAPLAISVALGLAFVLLQGREWVALLKQGLTMLSSNMGAFFYLIVGVHAAHAVVAIALLVWALIKLRAGTLKPNAFYTVQTFWYFVVGMWPVIYARVYF